jgi:unsaturated rhamnogalacturonyl hydrolase
MRVWIVLTAVVALACGSNRNTDEPDSGDLKEFVDIVEEADRAEREGGEEVVAVPFDWCEPGTPPDWACFADKRDPGSENVALALAIADRQIALHAPEELAWIWEDAVLMLAMVDLYRVTGEERIEDYYRAWMEHHIEAEYKLGTSDTCVPAAVAIALYESTGEEKYQVVVQEALTYLYEEAKRTEAGGISHLGIVEIVTLWVDSLYMFGNVLYGWGEAADDGEALDLYGEQYVLFAAELQDSGGFFTHASDWIIPQTPGAFWARGNSWVAVSGYQYLRIRAHRGESDPAVAEIAGKLLQAAVDAQDPGTGLWWTMLNAPGEIYLETSASALFASAMARAWRYGYVGDEILAPLALAMDGVRARIVDHGEGPVVTGISGPTSADKYEVYAEVPLEDDLPYGIGAVIYALVETSGLPIVSGK